MFPNEIWIRIFTKINNPFKLQCVSKKFRKLIHDNKNHIAYGILQKLGFKPDISESYRIYKNFVSKHSMNNMKRYLIDDIVNGYVEAVELLLTNPNTNPSINSNIAIKWASENGYTEVVKLLLTDPRVNPSANDNNAIKWASGNGHVKVVKLLLKHPKVDPSAEDNFAIKIASENGRTEVIRLLLADPRINPKKVRYEPGLFHSTFSK